MHLSTHRSIVPAKRFSRYRDPLQLNSDRTSIPRPMIPSIRWVTVASLPSHGYKARNLVLVLMGVSVNDNGTLSRSGGLDACEWSRFSKRSPENRARGFIPQDPGRHIKLSCSGVMQRFFWPWCCNLDAANRLKIHFTKTLMNQNIGGRLRVLDFALRPFHLGGHPR